MKDIVRKCRLNLGSGPAFPSPFGRRGLRSVGLQLQSSTGQVSACELPTATGIPPPPPSPLLFAFIPGSTNSSKPPALPHSDLGAAPTPWPPFSPGPGESCQHLSSAGIPQEKQAKACLPGESTYSHRGMCPTSWQHLSCRICHLPSHSQQAGELQGEGAQVHVQVFMQRLSE